MAQTRRIALLFGTVKSLRRDSFRTVILFYCLLAFCATFTLHDRTAEFPDGTTQFEVGFPFQESKLTRSDTTLASPSGCVTSRSTSKDKTICSLRHACWDFSKASVISVYENQTNSGVSGKRFLLHDLEISVRQHHQWEKVSRSKAGLLLDGTTALHFMYQSAFQHFVPDFLNILPAYWSPEEFNASFPKRSLFLTEHSCPGCSETYSRDLFHASLCGHTKASCTSPIVYPFETYDRALDMQVNKKLWCHEKSSCSKAKNISLVCFERLVVSLTGGYDWHFSPKHRNVLVDRVLGKEGKERHICVNQRQGTRQILNLDEVVQFLTRKYKKVIKVVYYEGLSFTEQVRTADYCSLLVAPHGGGMTNTAFVRSDSIVIELHPAWYQHIYFYEEAVKSTGGRYYPIIVPPSNITLRENCLVYADVSQEECDQDSNCANCFKDSSMYVDISRLEHGLRAFKTSS